MRFRVRLKHEGDPDSAAWAEEYEKDTADPKKWARDTVDWFNSTRRHGERARILVSVQKLSGWEREHDWQKINLVTISDRRGIYDVVACRRCGVMGKRYGLSGSVTRDPKFKAKVYQRCDMARKHLATLKTKDRFKEK